MDEAAWGALAITLTLLGGLYTYVAYQRRGVTAALRGAGLTLLPVAAWLTGVLKLLTEVGDAVGDWAVKLAFSPSLWAGVALAGVSVVLFVVSGFLAARGVGTKAKAPKAPKEPKASRAERKALPAADAPTSAPVVNDGMDAEMAEIEAILRKRGIT
jgi:hypothetical protein